MAGVFYVTNDSRCCHDHVLVETVVVHVVVVALKVASHLDRDLPYHGLALFLVRVHVLARVLFRDLDLCLDPYLVNYRNEKINLMKS